VRRRMRSPKNRKATSAVNSTAMRVADRDHAGGRALRRPGEQREGQRRS
jgi:hypothetical protein